MLPFAENVFPEQKPHNVGARCPIALGVDPETFTYDYIIVGGGTAGCVLAGRLSEDPDVSVLVIERGGVEDTWVSRVPMMSANMFREKTLAARWFAQPLENGFDSCLEVFRGEALGGTSRVNAMLYTRGAPGNYENWARLGNPGWSWKDVEPLFVRSEKALHKPTTDYRGTTGPWMNQGPHDIPSKPIRGLAAVVESAGIPLIADLNSPKAPAAAYANLDFTVDDGFYRASTYRAFVSPELAEARRTHLQVCTKTVVTRLELSEPAPGAIGDKRTNARVTGVFFEALELRSANGTYYARARKEVILCAGALSSPQVLMLSGIGPAAHLREKGIRPILDLPAVGNYLYDHIGIPLIYEVPMDDSLQSLVENPMKVITELLKYLFTGKGIFGLSVLQTAIFVPSRLLDQDLNITTDDPAALDPSDPDNLPDIEIMPIPFNSAGFELPRGKGSFSFLVAFLRPKSTGQVRLPARNPRVRPDVELGFLSEPSGSDLDILMKGVRFARRLASEMFRRGHFIGEIQVPESDSDEDVERFVRANLRTTYHYTSTCRMGPEPGGERPAVVDAQLRVHGVDGLRIADTSVFPEIVATHTMAPAVMVAEKCADMLKAAHQGS